MEDPRTGNAVRHNLHEMLVIALLCVVCGGRTCTDMELFGRSKETFLRRFMTLANGIPSHDSFPRLFRFPDPDGLQRALVRPVPDWAGQLGPDVTAIDGKALRQSFEDASKRSPLHVVNAFAAGARLTPGQVRVDGRSNGITAMPALLELPDVRGMTATADAMHAQRDTATRITEAGGGYVLAPRATRRPFTTMSGFRWRIRRTRGKRSVSKTWTRGTGASGSARRPSATMSARCGIRITGPACRLSGRSPQRGRSRGAEHGDPFPAAQRQAGSGAVPDDGAPALGGGESAALGSGRDHGRGRAP